jgi:hypothetical protein
MRNLWSDASRFVPRFIKGAVVAVVAISSFAIVPALRAQESTANDAATSRSLVNSARSAAGLAALADDSRLDAIASAQAQRMADRDAIYHNPNLESDADAAGVTWQWIGENVGVGPDVKSVHDAFRASPGHHENIVSRNYNVIGTGVALGRDGSVFVAQEFAGLQSSSPTTLPASASSRPTTTAPAASRPTAPAPHRAAAATASGSRPSLPVTVAAVAVVHTTDVNALVGGVVDPQIRF